jgi:hypothetical protein
VGWYCECVSWFAKIRGQKSTCPISKHYPPTSTGNFTTFTISSVKTSNTLDAQMCYIQHELKPHKIRIKEQIDDPLLLLSSLLWIFNPLLSLGRFLSFFIFYTVGRTPWTGDQPVARPLPTHRTTQREYTYTDIHASSGIRTHHPNVLASEDGSCLRHLGHCDWLKLYCNMKIFFILCSTNVGMGHP